MGDAREVFSYVTKDVVLESGDPHWEAVISVNGVVPVNPIFLELGPRAAVNSFGNPVPVYAIHGDWRGFVNEADPARPGEYLILYGTGFGPVQPSTATGAAAPSDPPARAFEACETSLEVPFIGLAPGFVGFYQITIRVPDSAPTGMFEFRCERYLNTIGARFLVRR